MRVDLRVVAATAFALATGLAAACSSSGGGASGPGAPDARDPGVDPSAAGDGGGGPVAAEFGLDARPPNATCKAPARPPPAAGVKLERVFTSIPTVRPMGLAQPPGDRTRWFMASRDGTFRSFSAVNPTTTTVVASVPALSGKPVLEDFEGGFLGFAFHPKFAQNGRIYVSFTTTGDAGGLASEVGYVTSTDNGASFTSYTRVLAFSRPKLEHNGGGMAFGKDGYLYVGFGDGAMDGQEGQNKSGFFGKIHRIDVDDVPPGKTYGIPPTNPFASGGGEPSTFAWGLRNPFRLSVDRATGDVWVGDVGDGSYEEVNHVLLGGNYGWPCREGMHDHAFAADPVKCPSKAGLIDPVVEHAHAPNPNSRSVTGGIVYRGAAMPAFDGTYVYADFIRLELWGLSFDAATGAPKNELLNPDGPQAGFSTFAEDEDGELYALALFQDSIFRLVPASGEPPTSTFPARLSQTGCFDASDPSRPASGLVPFGVNAELWSDGAAKERFLALPDGTTMTVGPDGDLELPSGSVLVKSFALGGKRVETRLFVRHEDGDWAGYSYEWNDEQTDAFLLPGGKSKRIGDQSWTFPGRADCLRCHTAAAGRSLGLELGQLNGDHVYPSTNRRANQLRTLEHIGMFSAPLGRPPSELPAYPSPTGAGPLEARARAYLHGNCASCHQQGGGAARSRMDLRYGTPFSATGTCNVSSDLDDLGVADARIIAPGSPATSILSLRLHATAAAKMPPLARSLEDPAVASVIDAWIGQLASCP